MGIKSFLKGAVSTLYLKSIGMIDKEEGGSGGGHSGGVVDESMVRLLRQTAAEGAVLLKNEGDYLPFDKNQSIALFGRTMFDYFYTGYGSGGDVKKPYKVNLVQGLMNSGANLNEQLINLYCNWVKKNPAKHGFWANWPLCHKEMPIDESEVEKASKSSDCAVVVIGRASGEERDNLLKKGSYYLTDEEKRLLMLTTKHFKKIAVLLNIGVIIDFSELMEFGDKIASILILWQGGMESGNAAADLLLGAANPSGKLTDTIAHRFCDYPSSKNYGDPSFNNYEEDIFVGYRYFETFNQDAVLYPFGHGLSYTSFETRFVDCNEGEDGFKIKCEVTNIGQREGKQTVMVFVQKPCGVLGNPYRQLVAFEKSHLLAAGETQQLEIFVSKANMSSYDSLGASGFKSSYILQKGEYIFSVGSDVRNAVDSYAHFVEQTECIEGLSEVGAPKEPFSVVTAVRKDGEYTQELRPVPLQTRNLRQTIIDNLPKQLDASIQKIHFDEVRAGTATVEQFVSQLDNEQLEAISRGAYRMNSPLGAAGNTGVLGGVLQSLRDLGVPPKTTTDGPSGIRLRACCSLLPIGTLLGSTFNAPLIEQLYALVGNEMKAKGSHILLAPGMNIHRNPLCGRNFEYFSEDPLVSGIMGAAVVLGVQKAGGSATPKHFACNNQELNRNRNDSRLSERALREIYLKGFEICVKKAKPHYIMTSYNLINGVWGHYNYELCRLILRGEWGYKGCVMTDWYMQSGTSPEFSKIKDNAYRVRGGVNVLMPGGTILNQKKPDGTLLKTLGTDDGITIGELQQNAIEVLGAILQAE